MNYQQRKRAQGNVAFLNSATPYISQQRVKLDTSKFFDRLVMESTIHWVMNYP